MVSERKLKTLSDAGIDVGNLSESLDTARDEANQCLLFATLEAMMVVGEDTEKAAGQFTRMEGRFPGWESGFKDRHGFSPITTLLQAVDSEVVGLSQILQRACGCRTQPAEPL
ncbi:MAG: hypothetical protein ACE5KY_05900, partial [Candidatus Tectimicrobiota bacterium]